MSRHSFFMDKSPLSHVVSTVFLLPSFNLTFLFKNYMLVIVVRIFNTAFTLCVLNGKVL